jgi:GrpB-like predicted nucleotidyltransferase (UPF0157 family)
MKRFKLVQDWLDTNPPQEEQEKVLSLIHKGESRRTRRLIFEKETALKKLNKAVSGLEILKISVPKELADEIKAMKAQIESLKKDLPETNKNKVLKN